MADDAAAREEAERLAGIAYRHAVNMHESIIAGSGAVGWEDSRFVAVLAESLARARREALEEAAKVLDKKAEQLKRAASSLVNDYEGDEGAVCQAEAMNMDAAVWDEAAIVLRALAAEDGGGK